MENKIITNAELDKDIESYNRCPFNCDTCKGKRYISNKWKSSNNAIIEEIDKLMNLHCSCDLNNCNILDDIEELKQKILGQDGGMK